MVLGISDLFFFVVVSCGTGGLEAFENAGGEALLLQVLEEPFSEEEGVGRLGALRGDALTRGGNLEGRIGVVVAGARIEAENEGRR